MSNNCVWMQEFACDAYEIYHISVMMKRAQAPIDVSQITNRLKLTVGHVPLHFQEVEWKKSTDVSANTPWIG